MIFKNQDDEKLFIEFGHRKLWKILRILDYLGVLLNDGESEKYELVITSAIRERTLKPSFHPLGQAVDIRTKGKPAKWTQGIRDMLWYLQKYDNRIQHVWESVGQEQEHIHLEYDTSVDGIKAAVLEEPC